MAKLKLQNELMHSILMLPTKMPNQNDNLSLTDLVQAIEHAVSNHNLSSRSKLGKFVKHIENDFNTSKMGIYALFPACTNIYEHHSYRETMETPEYYSLNDIYIDKKSKAHLESLKKKLEAFTWSDILNWLSYLLKQNIRGNDDYIVALSNLSVLLSNNLSTYNNLYLPLYSKRDLLKNAISNYYDHTYGNNRQLVDDKQIIKVNEKVNDILASKQHFYLCGKDCTDKELHHKITKFIEIIKNYILQMSIKGSKPITCPNCHLFTYSKYKYCQNCGAKLK